MEIEDVVIENLSFKQRGREAAKEVDWARLAKEERSQLHFKNLRTLKKFNRLREHSALMNIHNDLLQDSISEIVHSIHKNITQ